MLVPYAMPEFQKWPEHSLDYMGFSPTDSPSFYYQYGMMLFPLFLTERYGNSAPPTSGRCGNR